MVRAESIQRALSMVESRFLSCDDIRVVHPIDPETFFVKDPAASEELAEADTLYRVRLYNGSLCQRR
jgi:hypothetical protein